MPVDYGVVAEAEKVARNRGVTIDVGSPATKLDEETWDAISVTAPQAKGHLEKPRVDGNPVPVDRSVGDSATGTVRFVNDSDFPITYSGYVEFLDPDGNSRGKTTVPSGTILDAGAYDDWDTATVTLDKEGTWELHAYMEGEPY